MPYGYGVQGVWVLAGCVCTHACACVHVRMHVHVCAGAGMGACACCYGRVRACVGAYACGRAVLRVRAGVYACRHAVLDGKNIRQNQPALWVQPWFKTPSPTVQFFENFAFGYNTNHRPTQPSPHK